MKVLIQVRVAFGLCRQGHHFGKGLEECALVWGRQPVSKMFPLFPNLRHKMGLSRILGSDCCLCSAVLPPEVTKCEMQFGEYFKDINS